MRDWYLYIIDNKGKFYVGVTTNLENRMPRHRKLPPLYHEGPVSKTAAAKRERAFKGWSRKNETGVD